MSDIMSERLRLDYSIEAEPGILNAVHAELAKLGIPARHPKRVADVIRVDNCHGSCYPMGGRLTVMDPATQWADV